MYMVKPHTVIKVPQVSVKGRTRTAPKSLRVAAAKQAAAVVQGATADLALDSYNVKMVNARKASIKNGSYVLPELTAAEATVFIKSSPLLAYLMPKPKPKPKTKKSTSKT